MALSGNQPLTPLIFETRQRWWVATAGNWLWKEPRRIPPVATDSSEINTGCADAHSSRVASESASFSLGSQILKYRITRLLEILTENLVTMISFMLIPVWKTTFHPKRRWTELTCTSSGWRTAEYRCNEPLNIVIHLFSYSLEQSWNTRY